MLHKWIFKQQTQLSHAVSYTSFPENVAFSWTTWTEGVARMTDWLRVADELLEDENLVL